MVTRPRSLLTRLFRRSRTLFASGIAGVQKRQWIGPLMLTGFITVFHFAIDPHFMFWHDLLRRAYYFPIAWAVYQSGLRGGAIFSVGVGAIFTVHLLTGWGHHLGSQLDQVYDIVGYLVVGFGVGLIVDRSRAAAVAAAQREWDVSLRGVISAAIHELKGPRSEVRKLADDLAHQSQLGTWEHSVGFRLAQAGDRIDDLTRDLAGIAKILSSRSLVTRPFEWAQRFANNPHLGGRFGFLVVSTEEENPPPAIWPISPAILDEVMRCLLEDVQQEARDKRTFEITLSESSGDLVIECWSGNQEIPDAPPAPTPAPTPERGWVRMKLMELTWSRYLGVVQLCEDGRRSGFRLQLMRARVGVPSGGSARRRPVPARRIQESNSAYLERAASRRVQVNHVAGKPWTPPE